MEEKNLEITKIKFRNLQIKRTEHLVLTEIRLDFVMILRQL